MTISGVTIREVTVVLLEPSYGIYSAHIYKIIYIYVYTPVPGTFDVTNY